MEITRMTFNSFAECPTCGKPYGARGPVDAAARRLHELHTEHLRQSPDCQLAQSSIAGLRDVHASFDRIFRGSNDA